jgi:small-conductance mechanosensitive channel
MSMPQWLEWLPRATETVYFGNPLWLSALVVMGIAFCHLFLSLVKQLLISFVVKQNLSAGWKEGISQVLKRTKPYFLFGVSLFVGLEFLELSARADKFSLNAFKFVCFLQAALWLDRGLMLFIKHTFLQRAQNDPQFRSDAELNSPRTVIITFMARLLIVATFVLMFLDNLGVNITALVTGLGIGGVAVALALQNILGDLFASLAIALDKPFEIGDVITISPHTGTVEKVGLKTTRILLNSGEQLVIGNQEILRNRIQNFKKMQTRRVSFPVYISVQSNPSDVERLLEEGRLLISSGKNLRCDRAWVKGFGTGGLQLEWTYTVLSADYDEFTSAQQKLSLGLLNSCKKLNIRLIASELPSQES